MKVPCFRNREKLVFICVRNKAQNRCKNNTLIQVKYKNDDSNKVGELFESKGNIKVFLFDWSHDSSQVIRVNPIYDLSHISIIKFQNQKLFHGSSQTKLCFESRKLMIQYM